MRKILLLAVLILPSALPLRAQGGFTTVSATVNDPSNNPYINCRGSAAFVPSPTATTFPTLSGSTFQTDVPISACDSFGAFTLSLADNALISDGHTGGTASQWRFGLCSATTPQVCFSATLTITGATQNISAALKAASAPLPVVTNPASLAGNNAFTGNNTHSGTETFLTALFNGLLTATAGITSAGTGTFTGNPSVTLGDGVSATPRLRFLADPTHLNWQLSCQDLFSNECDFIPSTALGGLTFSNPSIKFSGNSGDVQVPSPGSNSASVVTVGGTQTLTNKTLTSPIVTGGMTFNGTGDVKQNGAGNTPPGFYINRQLFSTPDVANNLPLGHDLVLNASGPADVYMAHVVAATTTVVSLVVGANTNFLVGSTANLGTGSGAGIVIGRNTANEENVASGSWSIVDATHLTVTCAKTHSGTTDIEQVGVSIVNGGAAVRFIPNIPVNGVNPSPVRIAWGDTTANAYLMYLPNKAADAWPYSGIGFAAPLTGFAPAGQGLPFPQHGDLLLRNATSSDFIRLQSSVGGNNFNVSDTQNIFGVPIVDGTTGGTPASSGAIRLINAHQTCTDNGAGANICSGAMQTKRVASCTTAAAGSAQCNTTVTWTTAFADTNYTATCMVAVPNHDLFILDTTSAQTASAIVVAVENGPGNSLATTGTLHCIAVHD